MGLQVTGEVGDHNPVRAVAHALGDRGFDGIVVSTLPRRVSRWLAMDLPGRLRRSHRLPVIHVEQGPEQVMAVRPA